jgi:outer membrane receptor protein involved in Fe transport
MRKGSNLSLAKALLLGSCAGALVLAAPAGAQDTPDADAETGADILDTNTPAVDPAQGPDAAAEEGRIVVTGSRIARRDFEANSPIVTVDEALLEQSSTAALESSLNKLPQFTPAQTPTIGGDIQPTATNTPGAATVSLRGLGPNRNLALVDGRRATPGNASGVVDINTIPAAAIERVEVITGGASATYGADAIAGVANFILKKNFEGLELDSMAGITQEGDGFEYEVSGIAGTDFADGRGNVSVAMSLNTREASYEIDRDYMRDLWADPQINGNRVFILSPGVALGFGNQPDPATFFRHFPGATLANGPGNQPTPNTINSGSLASPGLQGFSVYANPDGTLFTTGRYQQGGVDQFRGNLDGINHKVLDTGALAWNDTETYLVLPLTRYNVYARANYEINDWIGVFGQGTFSHVETETRGQGGAITGGWDVYVPYGNQIYMGDAQRGIPSSIQPALLANGAPNPLAGQTNAAYLPGGQFGLNCPTVGGCPAYQVFPLPLALQEIMLSRTRPARFGDPGYIVPTAAVPNPVQPIVSGANDPVELNYGIPDPRTTINDVETFNLTAGLEGSIPGTDWTWEAFINHGYSSTYSRQTGTFSLSRTRALFTSPNFGTGFEASSNAQSPRTNFGANFANCTSGMNIFTTPWENISADCKQAIRADLKNRSEIRQTVLEANLQGGLFDLPAGDLRFAAGGSFRELDYEFRNDTITTQGSSFQDQAIGIYPSSDSEGFIDVYEAYGELLIPLLSDIPAIQQLNLEIGGRISDYSTTGTSYTYKILGDWEVTDWLRLRGGYNRAERAPNIAELFLSAQQTFGFNAVGDVCSQRSNYRISANPGATGNNAANAANVLAMCQAIMDRTGGPGTAASYYGRLVSQQPAPGGSFAWPTVVGNSALEPEKADTFTLGAVIDSPFETGALSRLRLTVDWFRIKLDDAIGVQSVGAKFQQCLDPFYNPAAANASQGAAQAAAAVSNPLCQGITYDPAPVLGQGNTTVTYLNNGEVDISGIDGTLDWAQDIGPGTLTLNAVVNYYLHYRVRELEVNPFVDYTGTFGTNQNGLNTGAFEYKILGTIGYGMDNWRLSLQWQHLPAVEDAGEATVPNDIYGGPEYNLFNLNGAVDINDSINVRFGVDNLFNKRPPLVNWDTETDLSLGQVRGGSYNDSFYDSIGRRFYIGANVEF